MRRVLSLLILVVAYNLACAQVNLHYDAGFAPRVQDSVLIKFSAGFPIGSSTKCPHIDSFTTNTSIDTVFLTVYYDLQGLWPHYGCGSNDTENIGVLLTSITAIHVSVYSYDETDTIHEAKDTTLLVALSVPSTSFNIPQISISPNPVADELFIEHAKGTLAEVYDIMGRLVYKNVLNSDREPVDTKYWQEGLYMIRLNHEEGNSVVKKVMKE